MSAEVLVFDILAVLAVIAGLGVILLRNPVHSAVSLVVTFINLAGIFVLLRAEFLAVVQIIVYTGAILVLVLFVIMLVDPEELPEFHRGEPLQRAGGFIIGLMLLGELAAAILTRTVVGQPGPWTEDFVQQQGGNVQVLGQFLYSGYILPIQAIAVILLVGTIGALVLARPDAPATRPRPRSTGTISLGHPRGAEGEFHEPLPIGAGVGAGVARSDRRGEMREGLIFVKDAESYSDNPAWELEFTEPEPDDKSYAEDGFGIGREGGRS
jgi:NADH-quinone oxidoreductase subunit J